MKTCSKCKIEKHTDDFSERSDRPGKLRSQCDKCRTNTDMDRYFNGRERVRAKRGIGGIWNQTIYHRNRRKNDPAYRLKCNLRTRIYLAIKRKRKSESTMKLVGCNIKELQNYLESMFRPGMTWNNYGKWHVDHKIPLASFDLSDHEQLKNACHYTNLQPLWAFDNLSKSNRLET